MHTPSPTPLVEKFINVLMRDGKKVHAHRLFHAMIQALHHTHGGREGVASLYQLVARAVEHVAPSVEVRRVRVAGTTYLVPAALPKRKQHRLAMHWLIQAARARRAGGRRPFAEVLADEISDASRYQGAARGRRDDMHRLAEANRAYIRYRWW
jgi:small subunit ribosomal protein S7